MSLTPLVQEIKQAQDCSQQIQPFSQRIQNFDNAMAYQLAQALHKERLQEGAKPIGRKIGFTNPEMWARYGVQEPVWSYVYKHTVVFVDDLPGQCDLTSFTEPKIEPEIILHFNATPPDNASITDIIQCIDWVAHGFEIVQSHFPDWQFQAADTIADSALHAQLFIGKPQTMAQLGTEVLTQLTEFTLDLYCNQQYQEQGRGANVLGSPIHAIAHLIAVLNKQANAQPLQAGELVTTGTLTSALTISPGEQWHTCLQGIELPGITLNFTA